MSFVLSVAFAAAGVACFLPALVAEAQHIWIDVPFVKQQKNGCGAASLSMMIQYWQHQGFAPESAEADAESIHKALYSPERKGTLGSNLQRYLENQGFQAHTLQAEWRDLAHHLSRGRPLILCLKQTGRLHYVVAAGLSEIDGFVLLNDPARRKLVKVDRTTFLKQWARADNWALLAVPRP